MIASETRVKPNVMEIIVQWSGILNAAGLDNREAVKAAAIMFGFVVINATAEEHTASLVTEERAHRLVDRTVDDVHDFITKNYAKILNNRPRVQQ